MGKPTQPDIQDSDAGSVWTEYVTIILGGLFGVGLLAMAVDALRRVRAIDRELVEMTGPTRLHEVADTDGAA